jgi:prenylcysteine oxidase/farnesylcysteine lyase
MTVTAQNIDKIHALGGTVSMATAGATSVEGGNYKIFENFVNKSGAKLFLNTSVSLRDYSFSAFT